MKVCSNGPGHMTKMAAMPIYGKPFKNLLQNQKADASTLAHTNLSPFAQCTLGLNCHSPAIFIKIFYVITVCMTQGFTSTKF